MRMFADAGLELFVAQSYAKNFGLYNERVGNLCLVVNDTNVIAPIKSQITLLVRAMWSVTDGFPFLLNGRRRNEFGSNEQCSSIYFDSSPF